MSIYTHIPDDLRHIFEDVADSDKQKPSLFSCSHASFMPTPTAVLRASLERHNDVFESLLKLIPAQFYIVNDETEDQVWKIPSFCMAG